jgi:phosphoribosyl 1,2-cyclic phosphodiesterase
VEAGNTRILVDAGFSAKQLRLRLERARIDPESLDAVVLTHEHSDHTKGLRVFLKKLSFPIYSTVLTAEVVKETTGNATRWVCFEAGQSFQIGDLHVESFPVMHDAVDPVGFVFRGGGASLGFISDVGHAPDQLRKRLEHLCGIYLEANYEQSLLDADGRRPWPTKKRIASRHGHLSNEQAAELAAELAHPGLRYIILGHLSRDCNKPDLARTRVRRRLNSAGWSSISIHCVGQDEPTPWFDL